jgi:hypothetical protein
VVIGVTNADRIGLPSFIGWLVNNGTGTALLLAWLITPVILYLVGVVFESRIPFLDFKPWKDAFRGFMPGDLLLGWAFASAVHVSASLDQKSHWYNSGVWHAVVFFGAIVGGLLARKFLDAPMYTSRQMKSPSKLYHDFAIYCGYGYLMFTTCIAALVGTSWHAGSLLRWKLAIIGSVVLWVCGLITDQVFTPNYVKERKIQKAHPDTWWPIWKDAKGHK